MSGYLVIASKSLALEGPWWLSWLGTRHSVYENVGLIPGLTQWVKDPALQEAVGHRCSDPVLLWLWRRPAAGAPFPPLVQELLYATGVV